MRNQKMPQQWSAYHYWHLTYVKLLEKEFKSLESCVIIGFQKLTVHFKGANESFIFSSNHQVSDILTKYSIYFYVCFLSAFVGKPLKYQIQHGHLPKTISGARPLWRLCLQIAFLQGLNRGVVVNSWWIRFFLPMKEKLFISEIPAKPIYWYSD